MHIKPEYQNYVRNMMVTVPLQIWKRGYPNLVLDLLPLLESLNVFWCVTDCIGMFKKV